MVHRRVVYQPHSNEGGRTEVPDYKWIRLGLGRAALPVSCSFATVLNILSIMLICMGGTSDLLSFWTYTFLFKALCILVFHLIHLFVISD